MKRQEAERQRRLKEDAQALARKNQEINQRLEEAKRMQELADQERAAAKARLQQQMVRMGRVGVAGVCVCVCVCVHVCHTIITCSSVCLKHRCTPLFVYVFTVYRDGTQTHG